MGGCFLPPSLCYASTIPEDSRRAYRCSPGCCSAAGVSICSGAVETPLLSGTCSQPVSRLPLSGPSSGASCVGSVLPLRPSLALTCSFPERRHHLAFCTPPGTRPGPCGGWVTPCPRPTREAAHGCGLPGAGGMSGCPVTHVKGRLCSEPSPGLESHLWVSPPFPSRTVSGRGQGTISQRAGSLNRFASTTLVPRLRGVRDAVTALYLPCYLCWALPTLHEGTCGCIYLYPALF